MPNDDETPMTKERWEKMMPNDRFEYHFRHMADPEYRKWRLNSVDRSTPGREFESKILKGTRAWKLEKRKLPDPNKLLKSFDPATVCKILKALYTPATLSMLKNNKDRLNRTLTATSLRQYLDALLTRGYITITNVRFERKDYPNNTIPRKEFSFYYTPTRGGKKYVRRYERVLDMLSELDSKGPMDRV